MTDIKGLIDFWVNCFYNVYNCYKSNGGIYFYLTIAVILVYPVTRRIVRAIRGGR